MFWNTFSVNDIITVNCIGELPKLPQCIVISVGMPKVFRSERKSIPVQSNSGQRILSSFKARI